MTLVDNNIGLGVPLKSAKKRSPASGYPGLGLDKKIETGSK